MNSPIGLFSETSLADLRDVHAYYDDLRKQIRLADALGFDFFSATQSYGRDFPDTTFSVTPDPLMLFASESANTKKIKVLTGILVAPFHHPAMAVSHAAAADALTDGRVMLGIGRGHPWLYERLGFDQSTSRERFAEFCAMTAAILDEPTARHNFCGEFWDTREFELLPGFVNGRPEVYVAQVGGVATADLAVKHRFGMLYPSYLGVPLEQVIEVETYFQEYHHRRWGQAGNSLLGVQIYAAADEETAISTGARALSRQLMVFARNMTTLADQIGDQYPAYGPLADFFTHMSDQNVCRETVLREWPRYLAVWGTADQCLAKFTELFNHLRPHGLILNIDAGDLESAEIEEAMRYVGENVLPGLREMLEPGSGQKVSREQET